MSHAAPALLQLAAQGELLQTLFGSIFKRLDALEARSGVEVTPIPPAAGQPAKPPTASTTNTDNESTASKPVQAEGKTMESEKSGAIAALNQRVEALERAAARATASGRPPMETKDTSDMSIDELKSLLNNVQSEIKGLQDDQHELEDRVHELEVVAEEADTADDTESVGRQSPSQQLRSKAEESSSKEQSKAPFKDPSAESGGTPTTNPVPPIGGADEVSGADAMQGAQVGPTVETEAMVQQPTATRSKSPRRNSARKQSRTPRSTVPRTPRVRPAELQAAVAQLTSQLEDQQQQLKAANDALSATLQRATQNDRTLNALQSRLKATNATLDLCVHVLAGGGDAVSAATPVARDTSAGMVVNRTTAEADSGDGAYGRPDGSVLRPADLVQQLDAVIADAHGALEVHDHTGEGAGGSKSRVGLMQNLLTLSDALRLFAQKSQQLQVQWPDESLIRNSFGGGGAASAMGLPAPQSSAGPSMQGSKQPSGGGGFHLTAADEALLNRVAGNMGEAQAKMKGVVECTRDVMKILRRVANAATQEMRMEHANDPSGTERSGQSAAKGMKMAGLGANPDEEMTPEMRAALDIVKLMQEVHDTADSDLDSDEEATPQRPRLPARRRSTASVASAAGKEEVQAAAAQSVSAIRLELPGVGSMESSYDIACGPLREELKKLLWRVQELSEVEWPDVHLLRHVCNALSLKDTSSDEMPSTARSTSSQPTSAPDRARPSSITQQRQLVSLVRNFHSAVEGAIRPAAEEMQRTYLRLGLEAFVGGLSSMHGHGDMTGRSYSGRLSPAERVASSASGLVPMLNGDAPDAEPSASTAPLKSARRSLMRGESRLEQRRRSSGGALMRMSQDVLQYGKDITDVRRQIRALSDAVQALKGPGGGDARRNSSRLSGLPRRASVNSAGDGTSPEGQVGDDPMVSEEGDMVLPDEVVNQVEELQQSIKHLTEQGKEAIMREDLHAALDDFASRLQDGTVKALKAAIYRTAQQLDAAATKEEVNKLRNLIITQHSGGAPAPGAYSTASVEKGEGGSAATVKRCLLCQRRMSTAPEAVTQGRGLYHSHTGSAFLQNTIMEGTRIPSRGGRRKPGRSSSSPTKPTAPFKARARRSSGASLGESSVEDEGAHSADEQFNTSGHAAKLTTAHGVAWQPDASVPRTAPPAQHTFGGAPFVARSSDQALPSDQVSLRSSGGHGSDMRLGSAPAAVAVQDLDGGLPARSVPALPIRAGDGGGPFAYGAASVGAHSDSKSVTDEQESVTQLAAGRSTPALLASKSTSLPPIR